MCKKYEKGLVFSEYITDEYHGRTGAYMTTDDCNVLFNKVKSGWAYIIIKNGFWLRSPDISLVDITEPFRVQKFGNKIRYFALFKQLTDLIQSKEIHNIIKKIIKNSNTKYLGFSYYISEGKALEGEIRIGGSDQRVNDLKNDLLSFIIKSSDYKKYIKSAKKYLGELRSLKISTANLNEFKNNEAKLINQLITFNKTLHDEKRPLNLDKLDNATNILPEHDVLIFIPTGCYGYIVSFISEKTADKIMLWEFHANKDAFHTNKYLSKSLLNKKCLIIDKSYTGKTLNKMADLVKKEGGIPIKLALFPKSRLAIRKADYAMILDRVFKTKDMSLKDRNWMDYYYKSVLTIN